MKLLATLIIFATVIFAHDNSDNLKVKILEKIITEISVDKKVVVWSDNKEILTHIQEHHKLNTTYSCEESTIIILQDADSLTKKCEKKHIFVLNYELLSEFPQSFGALFWKKGRPNIVIIKSRIKAQSIQVSNDLKPYLEEKVW
ncbi:hypothetical protein [Sulfurimonas sp.]|uniref:hypothetical protein n=1 Tax=Sulfurimonas sp. TaxID=2022749 RepID=UPI00356A3ABE